MNPLEPCPHCHRHVKVSETTCPFCAEAIALVATSRTLPAGRIGRAALFAFGVAASACGDNALPVVPDASTAIDAPVDGDDAGPVAIYAAAPTQPASTGTKTSG